MDLQIGDLVIGFEALYAFEFFSQPEGGYKHTQIFDPRMHVQRMDDLLGNRIVDVPSRQGLVPMSHRHYFGTD